MYQLTAAAAALMTTTLSALFGPAPRVTKLAGGFQFTEGPVWVPARQELLFSDIPANRIYRWQGGGADVWREPSHQANGHTLDPQGRLLSCEHETRRVTRTEPDGTITVLADRCEGQRLNSPNDIKCRRDGAIYFSDPPYGVTPDERELDFQGVYRLAPETGALAVVARDLIKPNGLCFSANEQLLYIADTERGHVRRFAVDAAGALRAGVVFAAVERPDGMETDTAGNLYVAGLAGLVCFDAKGGALGTVPLSERPSNLEFGGADGRTLFITARTSLYAIDALIPGAPPAATPGPSPRP